MTISARRRLMQLEAASRSRKDTGWKLNDSGVIIRGSREHTALRLAGAEERPGMAYGGPATLLGPFILAEADDVAGTTLEGGPDLSEYFVAGFKKWQAKRRRGQPAGEIVGVESE